MYTAITHIFACNYLVPNIALTLTPFTPPLALSTPPRLILSNRDRRLTELLCKPQHTSKITTKYPKNMLPILCIPFPKSPSHHPSALPRRARRATQATRPDPCNRWSCATANLVRSSKYCRPCIEWPRPRWMGIRPRCRQRYRWP